MSLGALDPSSADAVAFACPPLHALADASEQAPRPAVAEVLRRERTYRRALALADATAALAAVLVSAVVAGDSVTWVIATVPLIVILIAKIQGLYDRDERAIHKSTCPEWRSITEASAMSAIVIYLLWRPLTSASQGGGMRDFAVIWLTLAGSALLGRVVARRAARSLAPVERCLLVGGQQAGSKDLAKRMSELGGVELIGVLDGDQLDGSLSDIEALVEQFRVHRLIVALDGTRPSQTLELARSAKWLGVRVSLLPSSLAAVGGCATIDDVDGVTLLSVPRFGLSRSSRALKRIFDLVGATAAMVLLSPICLVLAIVIKRDSEGPVFFRQTRVGRNGSRFQIIKFRSMVDGADAMKAQLLGLNEASAGLFKIADDPRVTRVGAWLRRMHIDELPQLWNVIRGEMSLVGPRPLIEEEDRQFAGADRFRLHLTPGITGPWQIRGPMTTPLTEMAKLDYFYISNWSLWQDIDILLKTATHVIDRRGH